MLAEKRHEIILQILAERGSVSVLELKDILDTSESTIRRDLTQMDEKGLLTKVFGGAISSDSSKVLTGELTVVQKQMVNIPEKRVIGEYAASLIGPGEFVYLDAGTTTEWVIRFVTDKSITFVTNAVNHAGKLAAAGFRVIMIGGEIRGTTEAVVGSQAIAAVSRYHFSKGFFGTNGITRHWGFTTPDDNEAAVKSAAIERCHKAYMLADHDKFGAGASVSFAAYEDMIIITDEEPAAKYMQPGNVLVVGERSVDEQEGKN